ncbi:MAG TPA: sulfite exporter TauE/SafE family protein [Alphaproteobacteria bacterium]|nr:sulfite exporter TauE/SafE family protein [Alphaproteobacteria bacterium]
MQIYLPIAEMSIDVLLLLGLGGLVGFLSGLFGVGGGFLMTPLLIFVGVPPAVAVASQANQVIAASVSGVLAHWRRGNVDFKMGLVLLAGGLIGSLIGVWLYSVLRRIGQIDLVIALTYVFFLSSVGGLMAVESIGAMLRQRRPQTSRHKLHQHIWIHGLPLKMRFRRSRLYVSALLPLGLGFGVGVLSALMGVGGGFIMVPAMIYLLGMPTTLVVGTSLFQVIFVAINVSFLQAWQNQTVDIVLAFLLVLGAVIGAEFGTRFGAKLRGEQLRGLLALLVLAVGIALATQLVVPPEDFYSLTISPGSGG